LVILASIYFILAKRHANHLKSERPANVLAKEALDSNAPQSAPQQSAPASSNYLKRPLDRTHEVLDQVRKGTGGF
jgi:hypothetical protein